MSAAEWLLQAPGLYQLWPALCTACAPRPRVAGQTQKKGRERGRRAPPLPRAWSLPHTASSRGCCARCGDSPAAQRPTRDDPLPAPTAACWHHAQLKQHQHPQLDALHSEPEGVELLLALVAGARSCPSAAAAAAAAACCGRARERRAAARRRRRGLRAPQRGHDAAGAGQHDAAPGQRHLHNRAGCGGGGRQGLQQRRADHPGGGQRQQRAGCGHAGRYGRAQARSEPNRSYQRSSSAADCKQHTTSKHQGQPAAGSAQGPQRSISRCTRHPQACCPPRASARASWCCATSASSTRAPSSTSAGQGW